ncbi:MAG TPA: PDZ domain-containing protein [Pyrinomonadaceae bacterium]|nr:PDZ domain-containing protein [Pyrinomonadaceae bacterium]
MPRDLRFCRNCGYRLGEGSAEYTETIHFKDVPPRPFSGSGQASSFPPSAAPGGAMASVAGQQVKKRRRMSGMTWMFLGLLIFFVAAAGFTAVIRPIRRNISAEFANPAPPRSYVGVDSFDTVDGGVTFDNVEPPDSPADKAGLVGGDIVTTFDGQTITSDDQIMDLLGTTPIGKTVDVVYVRDGETKTTKLTTVSKEEFDRLGKTFRGRPEGRGRFGFDDDEVERVPIPGTQMFGVRLDRITTNGSADMAGIKPGDIVIEFDKIPIRTPGELSSRVTRAVPYSTITVVVMRGTERIEIPVKIGRQT